MPFSRESKSTQAHPECWACNRRCPVRVKISRVGWVSRELPDLGGARQRETYCADCHARWGWPEPVETACRSTDAEG